MKLLLGSELVDGEGALLEVEEPAGERAELLHEVGTLRVGDVHIESELEPKDWWYPYG